MASRSSPPIGRELVVVDAANVIGSRPDGWWRDRPAAVRRLLAALPGPLGAGADIVVVVEGAARAGVSEGSADGISVVHAAASGDDEIVGIVRDALAPNRDDPGRAPGASPRVTVVTSDRGLRGRVEALGAHTVGARTIWGSGS